MKRNLERKSKRFGRFLTGLLILCTITLGITPVAFAADSTETGLKSAGISDAISKTGQYIVNTVTDPVISSIGGEWAILGLARSGINVPQSYYEKYYNNVLLELSSKKGNLSNVKYTEYSRLILALTAIGEDVTNVGGYNLLEKLADYNSVIKQGINGSIFALIALDSKDYTIPQVSGVTVQTTRDMLIDYILSKEITDANGVKGGFALTGNTPDADMTGMALQALAGYNNQPEVKAAIDRALKVLTNLQLSDGGYESCGTENLESIAQVIVAKSALDVDTSSEASVLMKYCVSDGSMQHILSGGANQMATEQGFYALVAYDRYINGKNALYDMTDAGATTNTGGRTDAENSIKVSLNGTYLTFEQAPVNQDGRVLVPMRTIFEAMGAEVSWDGAAKKVTATFDGNTVELTIGSKIAQVNGKDTTLDVPASIINGSTMVPVRFISESLSAKVEWQKDTNTVVITN
jgi:hypothetical protein